MLVSLAHKDSSLVRDDLCEFDGDVIQYAPLTDDVVFSLYFVYDDCPRVFWKDIRVPMLEESSPSPRASCSSPRAHRTVSHDLVELSFSYTTRRRFNPEYEGLIRELYVDRTMQVRVLDEAAVNAERERVYVQERHCIVALLRMRALTHYMGSPQRIVTAASDSAIRTHTWESARTRCSFEGIPLRKEYQWDAHVADARDLELIRCGGVNALISPRVHATTREFDSDRTHNPTHVLPLSYERPVIASHQMLLQFFNLKNVAFAECTLKWVALNACIPMPSYLDIALAPRLCARVYVHKPKRRILVITRVELIATNYRVALEHMGMHEMPNTELREK
jgi:hypothetical protein